MIQDKAKVRKIAANYIYWPGEALVKNGYVEVSASGVKVVATGGQIKEIAGLEFYGGLIVPDYICGCEGKFVPGEELLPALNDLARKGKTSVRLAIIEGADLRALTWKEGARIRLL